MTLRPGALRKIHPVHLIRGLFILTLAGVIAACGPIVELPGRGEAPSLFALTPATSMAYRHMTDAAFPTVTLMVEEPKSPAALNTKRIALVPEAREFSFYASAEWIERAPRMLQSLLVTSFEEVGAFEDVGPENMTLAADYRLALRLRAFNADYRIEADADSGPVIRIEMMARLFRTRALALMGKRLIKVEVPVGSDRMAAIIKAFDSANRQAMGELVTWTLETVTPETVSASGEDQTTAP